MSLYDDYQAWWPGLGVADAAKDGGVQLGLPDGCDGRQGAMSRGPASAPGPDELLADYAAAVRAFHAAPSLPAWEAAFRLWAACSGALFSQLASVRP